MAGKCSWRRCHAWVVPPLARWLVLQRSWLVSSLRITGAAVQVTHHGSPPARQSCVRRMSQDAAQPIILGRAVCGRDVYSTRTTCHRRGSASRPVCLWQSVGILGCILPVQCVRWLYQPVYAECLAAMDDGDDAAAPHFFACDDKTLLWDAKHSHQDTEMLPIEPRTRDMEGSGRGDGEDQDDKGRWGGHR